MAEDVRRVTCANAKTDRLIGCLANRTRHALCREWSEFDISGRPSENSETRAARYTRARLEDRLAREGLRRDIVPARQLRIASPSSTELGATPGPRSNVLVSLQSNRAEYQSFRRMSSGS